MQYIEVKSILSRLKTEDTWFGMSYNMNLYRGCQHGCIYCDTRSECYKVGNISEITVKKNALQLLSKELNRKIGKEGTIGTGSMNDPYMPIEQELKLTRGALKIIAAKRFPVHVITKSDLVVRDLDLLKDISRKYAAVSFTITTVSDELARKVEPHAPTTSARFRAIEALARQGVYTGITMMPILPFINDTKENVKEIVQRAHDAGASYIIPAFGVTLRKGSREYFYQMLEQSFPEVQAQYEKKYGEQYNCTSPQYKEISQAFYAKCAQLKMSCKMNFYTPPASQQLTLF